MCHVNHILVLMPSPVQFHHHHYYPCQPIIFLRETLNELPKKNIKNRQNRIVKAKNAHLSTLLMQPQNRFTIIFIDDYLRVKFKKKKLF